MSIYTTEITSTDFICENPIHQRLLQAYYLSVPYIKGTLLELGCGEGRGIDVIKNYVSEYYAVDKLESSLKKLEEKYNDVSFKCLNFPPLDIYKNNKFDTITSFQVIEHIKNDNDFVSEIHRLLKPDGQAVITTPNRLMTLSRNPWHIREYTYFELNDLLQRCFKVVKIYGINGSKKVLKYHNQNKESVRKIMKYDILNLQYRLPAWLLKRPYEFLNKRNRNKLQRNDDDLVRGITKEDYQLGDYKENSLDLFAVVVK